MENKSACQVWIIALVCVTFCVPTIKSQGGQYKRVCYFTNWSKYRVGNAKFTADKIDPFLCTHLIFAFGDFDEQGNLRKLDDWQDSTDYEHFRRLKKINSELRTLLAIGGWNFGSVKYSNMVGNPHTRKTFVSSTVSFLRSNGFDGLDIDWEYPGERGGAPQDKQNLVTLCKELQDAFTTEARQTGNKSLILSAAVPASRYKVQVGYDVPSLNTYFDFINIMTYDFHGGWEDKTGQNSPLYPSPIEEGDNMYLNIRESANYWHKAGVPKDKLIIGLAAYGRSFLLNSNDYGLGAVARKGLAGPFTREPGFWSYYEICMDIENDFNGPRQGTVYYDTQQEVPFYVKGKTWVGYDNERSIKAKTRWIKENGFGGFMIWSLALDDFNKMCNYTQRPYPLIHAAIEELGVPITVSQEFLKQSQNPRSNPIGSDRAPTVSDRRSSMSSSVSAVSGSESGSIIGTISTSISGSPVPMDSMGPFNVAPADPLALAMSDHGSSFSSSSGSISGSVIGSIPTSIPGSIAPADQLALTIPHPFDASFPFTNPLDINCPPDGHHYYPDKTKCEKYVECVQGVKYNRDCPAGLHWDSGFNHCNWPDGAKCTVV